MPGKRARASQRRKGQRNDDSQTRSATPAVNNAPENAPAASGTQESTVVNRTNETSAVVTTESTGSPTTASTSENKVSSEYTGQTTFYGRLLEGTKRGRRYLVKQLPLVLPSLVLMLLGFKEIPQKIPLLEIAKQHAVGSPIIGGTLAVVFLAGLFMSFLPEPTPQGSTPHPRRDWRNQQWIIATGLSTTSFLLSSTLLVVVLVRPVWCPRMLCVPEQRVPITSEHGIHDDNLDVYFTAIQTSAYVLSKDPASYTLQNIPTSDRPESIGAQRIDEKILSPYRVVLTVHSLQQGNFGMFIEQVALHVKQVPPSPHPLNVWVQGPPLNYQSNLFQVVYHGEGADAFLPATYVLFPKLHVQLAPGESDALDVQVDSKVAADLLFQVQITYRVFNESATYTLILPDTFEVVFSNASNWHPYQLQDGHFVARS